MPNYDTIESARARIVELEEQLTLVTGERDSLSQNNATLTEELNEVKTLNQKLFNKVIQGKENPEPEEPEETVPTCEEFAKSINIL